MQAGDLLAAVELLAQHGLWGRLLQVAANLDVDRAIENTALRCAAAAFRSGGQSDTARELFNKFGDYKVTPRKMKAQGKTSSLLHTLPYPSSGMINKPQLSFHLACD